MLFLDKNGVCKNSISSDENQNVKVTKKSSEFDTHKLHFYNIHFF